MLHLIPTLLLSLVTAFEDPQEYLRDTSICMKDFPSWEDTKLHLESLPFREFVRQNDFFIDKTLLLRDLFTPNLTFLTVFYLPAKFLKSTNLQMIRTFVEPQLDANYSVLHPRDTFGYRFFTKGEILHDNGTIQKLLSPPLISKYTELIDQYQSVHPVVYFDLSNINGLAYKTIWHQLRLRVGHEYARHSTIGHYLTTVESRRFRELVAYFSRTTIEDGDRMVHLPSAMLLLGEILQQFYGRKPILLIDEFDSLVDSNLHETYVNSRDRGMVLKLHNQIVETFRQSAWYKVIVTGTFNVYKTVFEKYDVPRTIYHALGNPLSYYFGFTDTDLELLAVRYLLTESELELGRNYYRGYRMGPHYPIYNPWSILNYFRTKKLSNYWENQCKDRSFLRNMFLIDKVRGVWIGLLGDKVRLSTHYFAPLVKNEIWLMKDILDTTTQSPSLGPKKYTQTLMYLADIGQITWCAYHKEPNPAKMFNSRLPNNEIRIATYARLKTCYAKQLGVKTSLADQATSCLQHYINSGICSSLAVDVERTFTTLFNETNALFNTSGDHATPNQVSIHIVDYVGLRLRYVYNYSLDPMYRSGFIVRKSNITHVVSFNFNATVEPTTLTDQLKNSTHPWIMTDLENLVGFIVISVFPEEKVQVFSSHAMIPRNIRRSRMLKNITERNATTGTSMIRTTTPWLTEATPIDDNVQTETTTIDAFESPSESSSVLSFETSISSHTIEPDVTSPESPTDAVSSDQPVR